MRNNAGVSKNPSLRYRRCSILGCAAGTMVALRISEAPFFMNFETQHRRQKPLCAFWYTVRRSN